MRIYFIITEEALFHPNFLRRVIEKRMNDVVGITVTSLIPKNESRIQHLKKHLDLLGIYAFFAIGLKLAIHKILAILKPLLSPKNFYSIKGVAKYYHIPCYVSSGVNSKEHLDFLKSLKPDVIVSSNAQVFGKELLSIPTLGCINRHSSLLPKYGGIYPIFWALLNNENQIGVSIHKMVRKIDKGDIISQRTIGVLPDDTLYRLYSKAFNVSSEAVLEALKKLEKGDDSLIAYDERNESNFSFPTKKECIAFRKNRRVL